ncbi:MAG: DNA primase [Sphingomonadaceae bacterium]|nr:DNA primase [Sphingomonadaceae bacterium]
MTLSPAFLDELRARVSLSGVVGRRVKLSRAGREMKGCCPFHNEKTPSFYVNDDKGFYHCFGCGAHGDVIRFTVEQEGLGFIDAVKALAQEAGLAMPAPDPRAAEREAAAASLHDVTAAAAAFFAEWLAGEGGAARDYLGKRGVTPEIAAAFSLGFAPDSRTRLKTALASHGEARLVEAGLLVVPEGDSRASYDRFRGRLMFPIRDVRGRVIGFGGRILGDGQPKYLNSPDTPLFDKGRTLYNLDRAGPAARKSQRLIVVEGYMDVIALAQAGIADAVAPLGTALTEAQLALLWRYAPEPILCFDGDAAGQRAALRAALRALPLLEPGKSLRFATLPVGQDPDDLVRSGGAAAVERVLAAAEPLIDRLWRSETEGADTTTPERRAAVLARLDAHAAAIADPAVQRFYRSELRDRFYAQFRRPERTPWVKGERSTPSPGVLRTRRPDLRAAMVEQVLTACLLRPALIDAGFEPLAALRIADPRHDALRTALLDAYAGDAAPDADRLQSAVAARGAGDAAVTLLAAFRPGIGNLGFLRRDTPLPLAAAQFCRFLDALVADARLGDDIAVTNAHFRTSMAEGDFAAVRRNHEVRAELADGEAVNGAVGFAVINE